MDKAVQRWMQKDSIRRFVKCYALKKAVEQKQLSTQAD
jgi:hypothetical protein